MRWSQAWPKVLGVGAALLGSLAAVLGSDVWEKAQRVPTLEADQRNNRELLLELREDQREMRQDIKELLRRSP